MFTWDLTANPLESEINIITQGVLCYGRTQATGGNPQSLACLCRLDGELVAGGSGRTEYERLFVQSLWVTESMRGKGFGSDVLRKLEAKASADGCTSALIETLSDRTAQLYARLGYEVVARVGKYVGSFTKHIMVKGLGSGHANSEA